jgi:hypothetical protein
MCTSLAAPPDHVPCARVLWSQRNFFHEPRPTFREPLAPVVSLMKRDGLNDETVAKFKTYYRAAKEHELARQQQLELEPEPEPEPRPGPGQGLASGSQSNPDEEREEFQRIFDGGRSLRLLAIVSGMRRDGADESAIERFKIFYRVRMQQFAPPPNAASPPLLFGK